jgi:hypothetical protein
MPSDEPGQREIDERLRALDGPADDDLELSGPGLGGTGGDEPLPVDPRLPGGVDHTTAAVGAGALGIVLLGITGVFKRRWARRRSQQLDE